MQYQVQLSTTVPGQLPALNDITFAGLNAAKGDATSPGTTITIKPPLVTNSNTASFSFTATEASNFSCSLDGGPFTACTSPKIYAGLGQGVHYFRVRATDPTGNTDSTPAFYIWLIWTKPPDTTITTKPSLITNSTSATFNFVATLTGLGLSLPDSNFSCSLDGSPFTSCSSPKSYTGLAVGSHIFKVQAIDPAGTMDLTPAIYGWTIEAVTACPSNTTIVSGTLRTASQLCSDNNIYYQVNSTTSGSRTTAWYGAFPGVTKNLSSLKIAYAGKNSQTCSQTVSIWNWIINAWATLDQRNVGTGETLIANLIPIGSLSDYVSGTSGSGELRILVSCGAGSNFYSSGDLLQITYTTE